MAPFQHGKTPNIIVPVVQCAFVCIGILISECRAILRYRRDSGHPPIPAKVPGGGTVDCTELVVMIPPPPPAAKVSRAFYYYNVFLLREKSATQYTCSRPPPPFTRLTTESMSYAVV